MNDEALRLDNQLCFALHAASRAMVQAYQPLLTRLELTYPQYVVLLVLWEEDGASVKRLGERLYLDSGTLTPLLKRLEADGVVRRTRAAHDERVVEVWLTAKGKRLKQQALKIPVALGCKLGLAPDEFLRIRDDLRKLLAVLCQVNTVDKENVK